MKIRAFTNDSGSAWWRIESVARQINMKTDHEFLVFNHKQWTGDTLDGDIVVFQMVINKDAILDARARGAKVVYEIDDFLLDKNDRDEINTEIGLVRRTIEALELADMVTVTTEELAQRVRKYNKNVIVLPNYIDYQWWGNALPTKRRGEIRIGWAGSTSHVADLEYLAPIIEETIKKHDNVRFIYCGAGGVSSSQDHTQLMYGKDLFKNIPSDKREYYLGINTELWGYKSKTLYLDIALAPLIDDEFNGCKSNIKWQEYSLNKWAGIYSDVPAYGDIKHGMKAKNQEEFIQHIDELIVNEQLRKELAEKAYYEVYKNWTIESHFTKWLEAYKKCLNQ